MELRLNIWVLEKTIGKKFGRFFMSGESGRSFRHRLGELIDALEEEVFCDYVTEMSLRHRQCVNKSAIK